jgi:hypothetical protein
MCKVFSKKTNLLNELLPKNTLLIKLLNSQLERIGAIEYLFCLTIILPESWAKEKLNNLNPLKSITQSNMEFQGSVSQ